MARPSKVGLDYFPLDVVMEDNVELLEAECGIDGFGVLVKLYQKIYQNSYYIEWGEDNALLFSRKINVALTKVNEVVNVCFKRNILNKSLYKQHKILTSSGIQKRYFKIYNDARRKGMEVFENYVLIDSELIGDNVTLTTINDNINDSQADINHESSTQSKEEERKEEDIKEEKIKKEKKFDPRNDDYTDEFLKAYDLYPKPGGKRQGMINFYKLLKKHSYDELITSIKNYKEYCSILKTERKYIIKFSNFFGEKSSYEDYLKGEYEKPKKGSNKNGFHEMQTGKDYTEEELMQQLGIKD